MPKDTAEVGRGGIHRDPDSDAATPQTVFVAGKRNGGGKRKKHTDRDCPTLKKARTVLGRPRDVYPGDVRWCQICAGGIDRSGPQDHSHYNALVAAADTEGDSA